MGLSNLIGKQNDGPGSLSIFQLCQTLHTAAATANADPRSPASNRRTLNAARLCTKDAKIARKLPESCAQATDADATRVCTTGTRRQRPTHRPHYPAATTVGICRERYVAPGFVPGRMHALVRKNLRARQNTGAEPSQGLAPVSSRVLRWGNEQTSLGSKIRTTGISNVVAMATTNLHRRTYAPGQRPSAAKSRQALPCPPYYWPAMVGTDRPAVRRGRPLLNVSKGRTWVPGGTPIVRDHGADFARPVR